MAKAQMSLQPSEAVVVQAAATIYAAYITTGQVTAGQEKEWIHKSIQEAILLAQTTDANIRSDDEVQ